MAVSTRRLLPDALSAAASHLSALASVCLPDFNIASELFETLFCFTRGNSRKPCLHRSGLLLHNAGVKLHGVSCCGDFNVLSLSLHLSSLFPDKKMTGDQCS